MLFFSTLLTAQSAAELKAKRQRLLRELQSTTKELDQTKTRRSQAITRLNLLQKQIEQRRELISTLNLEIELTEERIARNEDVVNALNLDLERMRQEYAETLRAVYRSKLTNGKLAFLFSATGLNDGFRRIQYLRQYQAYRRRQSRLILDTQSTLSVQTEELEEKKVEKGELLIAAQDQGSELEQSLSSQTNLVDELTGTERRLYAKVKKQQEEHEELNKAVENAIAAEMASRRRRERNSSPNSPAPPPAVGADFVGYRGRLPWPAKGEISKAFGRQPHPDVPSVTINNGGIDIEAGRQARVQAVFPGEVISSRLIPGYRHTIMVRHGDYYTVYSNLDRALVEIGDELEAGTTIGFTSPGGDPLHFELWKGRDRQDPTRWLE